MSGFALGLCIGFGVAGGAFSAAQIRTMNKLAKLLNKPEEIGNRIRGASVIVLASSAIGYGLGYAVETAFSDVRTGRDLTEEACKSFQKPNGGVKFNKEVDGNITCLISPTP